MHFSSIFTGIVALAGMQSVHTLDSTEFCGEACHRVMEPEYVAYQRSAHSRVECVQCHIGDGASWFVKAKRFDATKAEATTWLNHIARETGSNADT